MWSFITSLCFLQPWGVHLSRTEGHRAGTTRPLPLSYPVWTPRPVLTLDSSSQEFEHLPILHLDKAPALEGAPVTKGQAPADTTVPKPGSARTQPGPFRLSNQNRSCFKEHWTRSPGTWARVLGPTPFLPSLYQHFPNFSHLGAIFMIFADSKHHILLLKTLSTPFSHLNDFRIILNHTWP